MTDSTTSTTPAEPVAGILSPQYLWTTIGSFALIFLGAFEALAVTTIMPIVATDLDGQTLYSVAFSGTLAASVVGMVVAGRWSDSRGPVRPLIAAMGVFLVGLLLSGFALDMLTFIAGRLLQGLGSGAINVALYVVVARLYPAVLHPKIFGLFAAAWVLPSMIGPPVAGVVAETISWHWVFLGVAVLCVLAVLPIVPALRALARHSQQSGGEIVPSASSVWTIVWAIVVAIAVLVISIGTEIEGALAGVIAAVGLVVVVLALRPLLPKGTLLVRRGLPATVLLRGVIAAAFFATEIYLPYLLAERYGLPAWMSGLILTVGAVSWALASYVQGRMQLGHDTVVRIGAALLVVGISTQVITAFLELTPVIAALGWFLAGGGMGLIFPRISTLVLGYSTERDQGFNSAAMSIADATGGATTIAFAGLLFTAFGAVAGGGFVAALALTAVLSLAAIPVAIRVRPRP